MEDNRNFEEEETRVNVESNLTFLAIFGLKDELRFGVKESIEALGKANTNTKMLTGDHKETAIYVAHEAGIINKNDVDTDEGQVLSAEDFRDKV